MHRTTVARTTAAAAIVTAAMLASAGVASAGEPVLQACVGTTFSTAAANLPLGMSVRSSPPLRRPRARRIPDWATASEAASGPGARRFTVNTCND